MSLAAPFAIEPSEDRIGFLRVFLFGDVRRAALFPCGFSIGDRGACLLTTIVEHLPALFSWHESTVLHISRRLVNYEAIGVQLAWFIFLTPVFCFSPSQLRLVAYLS